MKDSVKVGWENRTLGEICDKIQDGAHHSPKNTLPVREPGTFPYVTSKNIRHWHLDESNVTYVGPEFHDTIYPRCNAEFGDVLLTKDGANTGQVTINTFREPISLLSSVCLIKPNRSKLDPRFLVYYIQSDKGFENITGQMTGAAIKRIILKNIKSSEIPLPPLEEQQRIVAVLDEAFEGLARARAHAEANLQNARELFSQSVEAFIARFPETQSMRLGDIVSRLTNGYVGPTRNIYVDEGIPYLLARHVRNNTLKFDGRTYVTSEFNEKNKKSKLKRGDVVLVQSGHIGHCAEIPEAHEGHNCHAMIVLSPIPEILTGTYLSAIFSTPTMQEAFQRIRTGSTVPHLTCKMVKELKIPVMTLAQQDELIGQIGELKDQTDALTDGYGVMLQDIDDLRQSLLQKAFAGELT